MASAVKRLKTGINTSWQASTLRVEHDSPIPSEIISAAETLAQMPLREKILSKQVLQPVLSNKKRLRFNFNGRLHFLEIDQDLVIKTHGRPENLMVCRHIAMAYLLGLLDKAGKKNLPIFDVADKSEKAKEFYKAVFQAQVGKQIDGFYRLLRTQTPESHLVHNIRLGQWLDAQFQGLQNQPLEANRVVRSFCVLSGKHAMGLVLERKIKFDLPYFVLKFYDPNCTTNHIRMVSLDPAHFSKLSLQQFVTEKQYLKYYPDGEHSLLYALPEGENRAKLFDINKAFLAAKERPPPIPRALCTKQAGEFDGFSMVLMNKLFVDLLAPRLVYRAALVLAGNLAQKECLALGENYHGLSWRKLGISSLTHWLSMEVERLGNQKIVARLDKIVLAVEGALALLIARGYKPGEESVMAMFAVLDQRLSQCFYAIADDLKDHADKADQTQNWLDLKMRLQAKLANHANLRTVLPSLAQTLAP